MCNEVMRIILAAFFLIPDRFITQEMCIKAVEVGPWLLEYVPDHFKTQEMCDTAVRDDFFSLWQLLDWFVTQQLVKIWHDDSEYHGDDDEIIKWYEGY